ncbi:MAG: hypothetical protein JXB62_05690 [Pirellulales bacterium]|nr:hypothetical protein [Pirellulales bacterium]
MQTMKLLCATIRAVSLVPLTVIIAQAALVGTDVGTLYPPDPPGSFEQSASGQITVGGSGRSIWGANDSFFYVHPQDAVELTDFVLTVRVLDFSSENPDQAWQTAGLMVRQTLGDDSVHATSAITAVDGYTFQGRDVTGGASFSQATAELAAPIWLRLEREGDEFRGWRSLDGQAWVPGGESTIPMGSPVYYGLAVTSHDQGHLAAAVFEHLDLTVLQETLTWDGQGLGVWNAPGRWTGGDSDSVPGPANHVVVQTDRVTVASEASAFGLAVDSGSVVVADGQSLFVGVDGVCFAADAALTLGNRATLDVAGGGTIDTLHVRGSAVISTGGDVSVAAFHADGVLGVLTKRGSGVLRLDNASGSGVSAAETVFRIERGTLASRGADPLGGAAAVTLAGGALCVEGPLQDAGLDTPESLLALDMSETAVSVTADSLLEAITSFDARFGSLALEAGVLTIAGADHGVQFERTSLSAQGGSAGARLMVPADLGVIEASPGELTFVKQGPADLVLARPNDPLDHVTFDVQQGRLIGAQAAIGTAGLRLGGGELVLAAGADGAAFRAPVVVADSTLTAGPGGVGGGGPLTVLLGNLAEPLVLADGLLTLQATDGYCVHVPGAFTGQGGLALAAGSVIVDRPIDVGSLHLVGGTLVRSGAGTPQGNVTVDGDLTLVGDSLDMTGSTLTTSPQSSVSVAAGRALTLADSLSIGDLDCAGTVTAHGISAAKMDIQAGGVVHSLGPVTADQLHVAGRLNLSGVGPERDVTIRPGGCLLLEGWNLDVEGATLTAVEADVTIGFGRRLVCDRALTVGSLELFGDLVRRGADPAARGITIAPGGHLALHPGTMLNMTGLTEGPLTAAGAEITVDDAELVLATPLAAERIAVAAGLLVTSAEITVGTLEITGGRVNTNSSHVTIGRRLKLGEVIYAAEPGSTFSARGSDLLAGFDLVLNGSVLDVLTPAVAVEQGLQWGRVFARDDEVDYPVPPLVRTPDLAATEITHEDDPPFGDNETHVFSGYFYDADGHVSFRESCNDEFYLRIDGDVKINDDLWSNVTIVSLQLADHPTLPAGWHEIELRLSNGGGSAGPVHGRAFSFDATGGTDFAHPLDTGDASMFAPDLGGLLMEPIHQQTVDLAVQGDSLLRANTSGSTLFGNLTLDGGATMTLQATSAVSVGDVRAADGAVVHGGLFVRGELQPGDDAIAALTVDGVFELGDDATYVCELDGAGSDRIDVVDGQDIWLGGTLQLSALDKVVPPDAPGDRPWGDSTLTILTTVDEGAVGWYFENEPAVGQHVGCGVFLTDRGARGRGVSYLPNAVDVDVFQAAPGDTDGDRAVNGSDIQAILAANKFGRDVDADWTEGDFNGDRRVNGTDIQAILAANLFGRPVYAATDYPVGSAGPFDSVTDLSRVLGDDLSMGPIDAGVACSCFTSDDGPLAGSPLCVPEPRVPQMVLAGVLTLMALGLRRRAVAG